MADPYGALAKIDWEAKTKKNTKLHWCFERRLELDLHHDHAVKRTNPTTFKIEKVYGRIALIETKLVNKQNSEFSISRGLEETPQTTVEATIP